MGYLKSRKLTKQQLNDLLNSPDGLSPPSGDFTKRNEGTKGSNHDG